MGTILTIASSKGGTGKTTLAQFLAANLARRGYQITVVDAVAGTAFAEWHKNAYEGAPLKCVSEGRPDEVIDVAQTYAEQADIVLIDSPGFQQSTSMSAISTADFVLIPVMPDRGSLREAIRTTSHVERLSKKARRYLPFRLVGSAWRQGGQIERITLDFLAIKNLPILTRTVPRRAAYGAASFTGKMPISGKPGLEADQFINELIDLGAIPAAPGDGRNAQCRH